MYVSSEIACVHALATESDFPSLIAVTDLLPVPVPEVSTFIRVLEEELSPMQCWKKCLHPSQRFA